MAIFNGYPVKIAGTGKYVPEKVMTNFDFEKILDTSDEWIRTRSGIRERHYAADDELCSDLAAKAGRAAIEDSGLTPEDIDLIIVSTDTPDCMCPAVSAKVQAALGASNAGIYDLNAGCTGSLTAMLSAISGIASGIWKNVLVIGAERFGEVLDWNDRTTCILFGDGAGACVLARSDADGPHFVSGAIAADGAFHDYITIDKEEGFPSPVLRMKGRDVFKFVSKHLPDFVNKFCEENGIKAEDVDFWVLHQANTRIIDALFKRINVSADRTLVNIGSYGNTSAASLVITLDEAMKAGRIKNGEKIMFTAFGAGMTLGALLYEA